MKRTALLSAILLLSAVWAMAQYGSSPSTDSQTTASTGKTTIEGCLAGTDGSYTLTDKSGTTYQLTGNTAKLQAHVGHTIQITGSSATGTNATGSQSSSMSAPADTQQTFNVASFKHVSPNCSSPH